MPIKLKGGRLVIGFFEGEREEDGAYIYCYDTVEEDDHWQLMLPRIRIDLPRLYIRGKKAKGGSNAAG